MTTKTEELEMEITEELEVEITEDFQRVGKEITDCAIRLQEDGIDPVILVVTLISCGVYHAYQVAGGNFSAASMLIEGGQMSGAQMYTEDIDGKGDDATVH